jgi:predicted nucleic acid-binding protein
MLLDTSGLLCLIDRSESHHDLARGFYRAATRRLTHGYVLAEWVALAQVRGVSRPVALQFASDLVDDPAIEIVWVDGELHREAMTLLANRLDKTYSLCDAVSFVVMRRLAIDEALTTDRHFEQEGFRRLLA